MSKETKEVTSGEVLTALVGIAVFVAFPVWGLTTLWSHYYYTPSPTASQPPDCVLADRTVVGAPVELCQKWQTEEKVAEEKAKAAETGRLKAWCATQNPSKQSYEDYSLCNPIQ